MVARAFKDRLCSSGFSLIELTIVIVVIGIMAVVVMTSLTSQVADSRQVATEREMDMLARAIVGDPTITGESGRSDFGYVGDIGAFPLNLQALAQNPGGYATWQGPYIEADYLEDVTNFRTDEWGLPYNYTGGVTITSTGSGKTITRKLADATTDYLLNTLTGIIRDKQGNAPGSVYADSIQIEIIYPDGAGLTTSKATSPNSGGAFSIDSLPVGTHRTLIVYEPTLDTLTRYVTLLPRHKRAEVFALPVSIGGSGAAVIYREFTEARRTSNGKDITINTPGGTGQGDLLIAVVVTDDNESISPPAGEGWSQVIHDSNEMTLGVWWKNADAAESPSHTFTWGTNERSYAFIMRFTGHDSSNPIHTTAATGGISNSPACNSVMTTIDDCLILRIGGFDGDAVTIDDPGLAGHTAITMDESSATGESCSGGAGYVQQMSAGPSGAASFSLTAAEQYQTVTIALAPE